MASPRILPFAIGAVALTLALSACSRGPVVVDDAPVSVPAAPTEASVPVGTRENPIAVGAAAKYSESSLWTFTVGETDPDAWPEIAAENQFNSAPEAGSSYITVAIHLAVGSSAPSDGVDPWMSFDVEYVTAKGNTFGPTTCTQVIPGVDLYEVGTMYSGAEADFTVCAAVPSADVAGGSWKIFYVGSPADSAFFAGAE